MQASQDEKFLDYINSLPPKTIVKLTCPFCKEEFLRAKNVIQSKLLTHKQSTIYCSRKCFGEQKITKKKVLCKQCNKEFKKVNSHIKRTKNNFCSKSCAATYNNTHKTTGTRRSKLEKWLEEQLNILYPKLTIKYNSKEEINSELDIYIPSLNLAFELNGIFHYEPIYGVEKLASIQNNDNRKFQACLEQQIELVIIDNSSMNYFKENKAKKYLNIIQEILKIKLSE